MEWQLYIVVLVIAVAVLYLGWSALRAWKGAKTGCAHGCGCKPKEADMASGGSAVLIPVDQITLRRREADPVNERK
jgi:hypothetical protein